MNLLKSILNGFIHLAYPPLCLHCSEGMHSPQPLFCPECVLQLEMIDPINRCLQCFVEIENSPRKICGTCVKQASLFNRMAATFDYIGPAATLVSKLKYSDHPYLAKGMGAYMVAQFLKLNWPLPDVIVPVPIMFTHLIQRKYNQSLLLSESIGQLLNCPVESALSRKSGDFSHAGLSKKQRMSRITNSITLKKKNILQDKCILLIDDVMTTGSTLNKCAEALMEDCPSSLYALTFCRSMG